MLFINPSEVVAYSFLPREHIVSDSIRLTKIDIAQERFLRPRLGDVLYDALSNGRHLEFRDCYLKPALAFYVRYGLLEDFSVFIDENGVVLFGGDTENGTRAGSLERSGNLKRDLTDTRDETRVGTGTEKREGSDTGTRTDTRSDNITDEGSDKLTRATTDSDTKTTTTSGKDTKTDAVNENLLKDSSTNTTSHVAAEPWEEKTFLSTTATNKTNTYTTVSTEDDTVTTTGQGSLNDTRTTSDTRTSSGSTSTTSTDESLLDVTRTDNGSLDISRTTAQIDASTLTDATTGSVDTARRRYTPAPLSMIHTLQLRALSDANALMGKALRHLMKYPEEFPEYSRRVRTIF